ncbi:MAG: LPS assembly lipoprotein LptE [bacterium]
MIQKSGWLLVSLSLAAVLGCGYRMVQPFVHWPEGVRKVYVENIRNRTNEPGLEATLTEAFIQEFWGWQDLEIVNRAEAEAVFSGEVTQYTADRPLSFDQDQNIREYEISLHVDIQLTEVATGRILWQEEDRIARESYQYFQDDLSRTRAEERRAQVKAAQDLARELLDRGFMGH